MPCASINNSPRVSCRSLPRAREYLRLHHPPSFGHQPEARGQRRGHGGDAGRERWGGAAGRAKRPFEFPIRLPGYRPCRSPVASRAPVFPLASRSLGARLRKPACFRWRTGMRPFHRAARAGRPWLRRVTRQAVRPDRHRDSTPHSGHGFPLGAGVDWSWRTAPWRAGSGCGSDSQTEGS
jgi:hypothetical protein